MEPVLAHGDLHEGQFLVDESGTLTGILDWGFGGVLSPLADFTGVRELFGGKASYGDVRRHMWMAYADGRSGPLPGWEQIQLAMTASTSSRSPRRPTATTTGSTARGGGPFGGRCPRLLARNARSGVNSGTGHASAVSDAVG